MAERLRPQRNRPSEDALDMAVPLDSVRFLREDMDASLDQDTASSGLDLTDRSEGLTSKLEELADLRQSRSIDKERSAAVKKETGFSEASLEQLTDMLIEGKITVGQLNAIMAKRGGN